VRLADTLRGGQKVTCEVAVTLPDGSPMEGEAHLQIRGAQQKVRTRNNDGEGVFEYLERPYTLFRGKATCTEGEARFTFIVVDDLHRQIFIAPRHRHAGTGSRSVDRFADMEFSVQTASVFIVHLFNHNTSPYFTPVLPTLRLMTSVS